jgi:hypothetical protein
MAAGGPRLIDFIIAQSHIYSIYRAPRCSSIHSVNFILRSTVTKRYHAEKRNPRKWPKPREINVQITEKCSEGGDMSETKCVDYRDACWVSSGHPWQNLPSSCAHPWQDRQVWGFFNAVCATLRPLPSQLLYNAENV